MFPQVRNDTAIYISAAFDRSGIDSKRCIAHWYMLFRIEATHQTPFGLLSFHPSQRPCAETLPRDNLPNSLRSVEMLHSVTKGL